MLSVASPSDCLVALSSLFSNALDCIFAQKILTLYSVIYIKVLG